MVTVALPCDMNSTLRPFPAIPSSPRPLCAPGVSSLIPPPVFGLSFHLNALFPRSPYQYHSTRFAPSLFSYSYALFCIAESTIFHLLYAFRTLCKNHPGWGIPYLKKEHLYPVSSGSQPS